MQGADDRMSYKKWIFCAALLSVSTLSPSFAQETAQTAALPFDQETKSKNQEIQLTVSSLDKIWNERQSYTSQTKILDFIKSEPSLVNSDFDVAWRVSRLVYYSGNFGLGKKLSREERVKIFKYGYEAGKIAKAKSPKRVEGYYWLATNLGSYGLAKGILSALGNAKEGRDALLEAVKIDPTYHWGGPYRILGRYYQQVPSVISFGDKKKALEYYNKAIEVDPGFRLNLIYMAVLQHNLGNKDEAVEFFRKAEKAPDQDGKNEENLYKEDLRTEELKANITAL